MERLKIEQILKPGAVLNTEKIDFNDPKNAHIKKAFEETKKRQDELMDLKKIDPSVYNLRITI